MDRVKVMMVSTPETARQVDDLLGSLATRCDALPEPRPVPTVVSLDELGGLDLDGVAAVVVLDQEEPPLAIRRLDSRLSFDAVVTSIRIGGRPRSDAMVLPGDVSIEAITACLQSIVHRQREIDRLQAELATTARIAEGVQEEMSRVDEELQMAAMVQREFLPRELPSIAGTDLAAMWRPAGYVSGDIYDVFRLDEDHVGLFIADAVGHGVPAALMTMVICRSLPTKEISTDGGYRVVPPGEALERLNRFMVSRKGQNARFATAVYVVYDTRRRVARVASAGHPAVIHLASSGSEDAPKEIGSTGGLLGIFEDEQYGEVEVELRPGEGLVLHSDGFEQAFPHDLADHTRRRIPNERYREVIADLTSRDDPTDMIDAVRQLLDDHGGSLHQADDLTMICLRASAAAGRNTIDEASTSHPFPGGTSSPDRAAG